MLYSNNNNNNNNKYHVTHHRYSVECILSMNMEDHLKMLVAHAEPKRSHQVIVSDSKAKLITNFMPPMVLSAHACKYEMALTKLETYYSFANINETNSNVKVSFDSGSTWKLITIPTGCYELKAINATLQRLIESDGGKTKIISLSPNVNTLKCILNISDKHYQIDFAVANSICTVLGFDARIYKDGRYESDRLVDIMNVNSILVCCDIIGASRLNGIDAPVIYNFFPNVAPGEKIIESPINLTYLPITTEIISSLTCWLTDQKGRDLDLRGEQLTITFHLRACQ